MWFFVGCALLVAVSAAVAAIVYVRWPYRHLPGAPSSLLLGNTRELVVDPVVGSRLRSLLHFGLKHGKDGLVRLTLPLFQQPMVVVLDPNLVKVVLSSNRREWEILDRPALRRLVGSATLVSQGDEWQWRRSTINPAFHHAKLVSMVPTFARCSNDTIALLDAAAASGDTVDIHNCFAALTLNVIGQAAFGLELGAQTASPHPLCATLVDIVSSSGPREQVVTVAKTSLGKAAAMRDTVAATMAPLIASRRGAGDTAPEDLLTLLCAAKHPTSGRGLTDEEIVDECVSFLLAGHETTANWLSWVVLSASEHPEELAPVLTELDAVLGAPAAGESPPVTKDTLGDLPHLTAFLHEVLRVDAPVPMLARQPRDTKNGATLAGYKIPPGTRVLIAPWILQHNPHNYDSPDVFSPSRFLGDPTGGATSPFAFMAFSAGPRRCVGSVFAALEARVVAAKLLHRFNFKVTSTPVHAVVNIVRRPKGGLHVRATRR